MPNVPNRRSGLNLTHSVLIQKEIIQEKNGKKGHGLIDYWRFTVFKSTRLAELRNRLRLGYWV